MKLSKLRASTSTRQLVGTTIPRQNTTSFGMRAALKKGGSGYAGESGEVGGNPAKMHLARARRHGGRVKRDAGGATVSEGSKREAARLRAEAGEHDAHIPGAMLGTAALPMAAGTLLYGVSRGRLGRGIGRGVGGTGAAVGTAAGATEIYQSHRKGAAADRLERGLTPDERGLTPDDGREDSRAKGGSVKKGKK